MKYTDALIGLIVLLAAGSTSLGQQPDARVKFTITPAKVPVVQTEHHLLPSDSDLRDGNAAVVMLRMIWEQQNYMQNVVPKIPELMEQPYDHPAIPETIQFDQFQRILRRAAYMRDAEWNYPFNEEPHDQILLPDVQGLRTFLLQGMTLWVGSKIAAGDLEAAREGILVQLAGARHVARTPIMVNHFVAIAIAASAFDRAEILVQQKECPNLYWALAFLPRTAGDYPRCLEWEANMIPNSLPSLTDPYPPIGDEVWTKIASEFSDHMVWTMGKGLSVTEGALLLIRLDAIARGELVELSLFTDEEVERMGLDERIARWILHQCRAVHAELQAAFTLPAPQAIAALLVLQKKVSAIQERTGAPATPLPPDPVGMYLSMFRYGRRVKMLQVVEAIRDHLARNNGVLPATLDDIIELHIPRDPLTDMPFKYELIDDIAYLSTPTIPAVAEEVNGKYHREYVIEVAISR